MAESVGEFCSTLRFCCALRASAKHHVCDSYEHIHAGHTNATSPCLILVGKDSPQDASSDAEFTAFSSTAASLSRLVWYVGACDT